CQPPRMWGVRENCQPGQCVGEARMRKRDFDRKSRPGHRPRHGGKGPDAGRGGRFEPRAEHRDDRVQRAERVRPAEADEPRWQRGKHPDRAGQRPFRKKPWRPPARDRDGPGILYGWHHRKAALENPARRFRRLLATENAAHRLAESGIALPIAPTPAKAEEIEALIGPDAVHQGILAEADPLDAPAVEELEPQRVVLVLDQITDPHNVGAILRSAAAFAVEAVIMTTRHSPEATGVLAKAPSAALE